MGVPRRLILSGAAAGVFLLAAGGSAVASTDRYVAATGSDTLGDSSDNKCSLSSEPCRTVQHAVDRAASGETVHVDAGRYEQPLTIDKTVRVAGAQAGVPASQWGASRGQSALSSPGGVTVTGSDVVLDGVAISGSASAGVEIRGSGASVRNSVVSGNGGSGVLVAGAESPRISSDTIADNGSYGVEVTKGSNDTPASAVEVSGNLIRENFGPGMVIDLGALAAQGAGTTLSFNYVLRNGNSGYYRERGVIYGYGSDGAVASGVDASRNLFDCDFPGNVDDCEGEGVDTSRSLVLNGTSAPFSTFTDLTLKAVARLVDRTTGEVPPGIEAFPRVEVRFALADAPPTATLASDRAFLEPAERSASVAVSSPDEAFFRVNMYLGTEQAPTTAYFYNRFGTITPNWRGSGGQTVAASRPGFSAGSSGKTSTATSSGAVRLRDVLTCPGAGPDCKVSIAVASSSAEASASKKAAKLASRSFTIKSGTRKRLSFTLNRAARRLLARKKRLKAKVAVAARRGALSTRRTISVTLKAPKRKRRT